MLIRSWCVVTIAVLLLPVPLASAEEAGVPDVEKSELAPAQLVAFTAPARLAAAPFSATTWVGYDGATENPRVSALVEAGLVHKLAIAVGADSTADDKGALTLRPLIAVRFQALEQEAVGVDATAAVTYRQDRFEVDGGFMQGTIAVGRRFDRLLLALNLSYGVDPEGDDREGEMCAAAGLEVSPSIYLGLDGRYRHDLGSSDPNRAERGRPESEALAGATAAYRHQRWAVMLETGMSRVVTSSARMAPIFLVGYGAAF
jgi:hypothetical protein